MGTTAADHCNTCMFDEVPCIECQLKAVEARRASLPQPESVPEPVEVESAPAVPSPRKKRTGYSSDRKHKTITLRREGPRPESAFTPVPNALFDDPDLTPAAGWTLAWLLRHQDGWETSTARLAEGLSVKWHTADRYCQALEALGYLTRADGVWTVRDVRP